MPRIEGKHILLTEQDACIKNPGAQKAVLISARFSNISVLMSFFVIMIKEVVLIVVSKQLQNFQSKPRSLLIKNGFCLCGIQRITISL